MHLGTLRTAIATAVIRSNVQLRAYRLESDIVEIIELVLMRA